MENKLSDFINALIEENKKLHIDNDIKDKKIEMLLSQLREWETVFSTDHLTNIDSQIFHINENMFPQHNGGGNG
ncbi:hypothetical protein [Commensalibacter nepenthis]|uniref:Uncharacterized protein n=1 Tax=Commensalibacter nepenthis TaxID=3043872 RepID=A0ABT6Q8D5_9PROT|nr:hypothetical protein [Commensalibacter sp. TBRC 10068]MDI2113041.1 hypothetical protein [Commensalibacter sp. TBRC 10068]